jgi:alanine racemase
MTRVEINIENVGHNLKVIKSYIGNNKTKIMAIVKSNAYGHGILEISKQVIKNGVDGLGIALVDDGIKLRNGGVKVPIYILGESPLSITGDVLKYNLTLSINSYKKAEMVSKRCAELGGEIDVHVNIDTGMNRVGINYGNAVAEIKKIVSLPNINVNGVFTHFSCAGDEQDTYTKIQWARFKKIIGELKNNKININLFHCSNSAAFLRYKEMRLDMVRLGIPIYGLSPFNSNYQRWLDKEAVDTISRLKSVLTLKTGISFIKKIKSGEYISYGGSFKTNRESIIATIPIGYADGYCRLLSNKSVVLINGQYAPIVGNITMDQLMVDITDINSTEKISVGDDATLIGGPIGGEVSADNLANLMGTINYEIICMLKDRIPRICIG